jgi:WD40 repeat protein
MAPLRFLNEPVHTVCLDSKGRTLVVAQWKPELRQGRPCRVSIWDLHKRQERKSWTFPAVWPRFALSPDGCWLASGHPEGAVQICRLTDGSDLRDLNFVGQIASVAFSPDSRLLAAATFEGMVKIWEMPAVRELPEFRAHRGVINSITFSPDSRRLLTAGNGAEALKLWDVATWQELITPEGPGDSLQQIAFSPDGQQLMALNGPDDVLCWRVPSLQEIGAKEKEQRAQ